MATASSPATPVPVGRFAPSPTGPLHLGSLVAAVGSYLDARMRRGHWLVRIEDLDTARVIPGCADNMLATLDAFGFEWDGQVLFQSTRHDAYRAALEELRRDAASFECSCSRRDLGAHSGRPGQPYPGTCLQGPAEVGPTATRLRVDRCAADVAFEDLFQGHQHFSLADFGAVVIRRRDGVPSYQLAVVVDDAMQQITHVIRGYDLLTSTPWQICLQQALRLPRPRYGHLPLVMEDAGTKLAKSSHSIALDTARAPALLVTALGLLAQRPPTELQQQTIAEIWAWAHAHWQAAQIQGRSAVYLSPHSDSF
ncbi:MAG: tRNA glutamyl-Q(34) synthetase GluQRS [Proteobacteria bacterium]|nr:tRNA glutamyl-Q(34) synthetase GluQRS [Pseudomonadota bacterium]